MEADARRLLALLGLAIFFEGYGRALPLVALAPIGEDLGVGPSALSFALAVVACGALAVVVLGRLGDRFGRRALLLGCVGGYALLGAGTAAARGLVAFVVWQALARTFQDGAIMASMVIATEEIPAERRGVAQGMLGLVNQLGAGLAAFVLAGMALVPGGWRGLMLVNLAAVTLLPLLARNVPESRRWMTRAHGSARFPPRYRRRLVAGLALAFLAMSYDVAGFAFTAYVPMTEHGWSAAATSTMIIVAGGLGLPGWWVGGSLADRHGRRPCAVVFLVGLTLAEAAFFLLGSSALWPAFGAMVFCQSGKTAVTRAWVTELFPTAWRATTASWLAAAATLGGITGLALAGAAAPRLGIGLALTLVAVAGPLAAVTAFFLPETHAQDLDAIAHDDA